jgi:hypothetical protein
VKALGAIGVVIISVMIVIPGDAVAAEGQMPLPDVTVTAPGLANTPPYLREQWNSYGRNPYFGRYRVEEDKFIRVPCTSTRIAAPGATCLQGYKLDGLTTAHANGQVGGYRPCDLSLDVSLFDNTTISVEADILIFDPYKVTATGSQSAHCTVQGFTGYDVIDFADMNQVTRRGTNFRNLVGAGDDKSIEFDVDGRHCKAIRHSGPRWQTGYVYVGHISICRKDAAQVQADDVAYVFSALRVRTYEPEGNLRGTDANSAPTAPLPSNPTAAPTSR